MKKIIQTFVAFACILFNVSSFSKDNSTPIITVTHDLTELSSAETTFRPGDKKYFNSFISVKNTAKFNISFTLPSELANKKLWEIKHVIYAPNVKGNDKGKSLFIPINYIVIDKELLYATSLSVNQDSYPDSKVGIFISLIIKYKGKHNATVNTSDYFSVFQSDDQEPAIIYNRLNSN